MSATVFTNEIHEDPVNDPSYWRSFTSLTASSIIHPVSRYWGAFKQQNSTKSHTNCGSLWHNTSERHISDIYKSYARCIFLYKKITSLQKPLKKKKKKKKKTLYLWTSTCALFVVGRTSKRYSVSCNVFSNISLVTLAKASVILCLQSFNMMNTSSLVYTHKKYKCGNVGYTS